MLLRHYLEQGTSKSALARQLGVPRDTIHRWIRDGELDRDLDSEPVRYGPRPPVPTKLDTYRHGGAHAVKLVSASDPRIAQPSEGQRLRERVKQLPKAGRAFASVL